MNKVFLIGNLTREPELTETSNGVKICRFTLAVNRNYADAAGEHKADYFSIVCWRGLSENVSRCLHKGGRVCVIGSIECRTYESNDVKKSIVDIVAQDVEFLTAANHPFANNLMPYQE